MISPELEAGCFWFISPGEERVVVIFACCGSTYREVVTHHPLIELW